MANGLRFPDVQYSDASERARALFENALAAYQQQAHLQSDQDYTGLADSLAARFGMGTPMAAASDPGKGILGEIGEWLSHFVQGGREGLTAQSPQMLGEAGQVMGTLGVPAVGGWGESFEQWGADRGQRFEQQLPSPVRGENTADWVARTAGRGIGTTVPSLAAIIAGLVSAPVTGGASLPLAAAGGLGIGGLMGIGDIHQTITDAGVDPSKKTAAAALAGAVPYALMERVVPSRVGGRVAGKIVAGKLVGARGLAPKLATPAKQGFKENLKNYPKAALRSSIDEGATEGGQSLLSQGIASGVGGGPPDMAAVLEEALAGAVTGPFFGVGELMPGGKAEADGGPRLRPDEDPDLEDADLEQALGPGGQPAGLLAPPRPNWTTTGEGGPPTFTGGGQGPMTFEEALAGFLQERQLAGLLPPGPPQTPPGGPDFEIGPDGEARRIPPQLGPGGPAGPGFGQPSGAAPGTALDPDTPVDRIFDYSTGEGAAGGAFSEGALGRDAPAGAAPVQRVGEPEENIFGPPPGETPAGEGEPEASSDEGGAAAAQPAPQPRPEPTVPTEEKPVATRGRTQKTVFPERDEKVTTQYTVMEASDVVASHRPGDYGKRPDEEYPGVIQGRAYHGRRGQAAREHTDAIVMGFDPDRATDPTRAVGEGPPVVLPSGVVIAGNGRTLAQQRLWEMQPKKAEQLKQALMDTAEEYGLDPSAIEGMKQPMLVRTVADPNVNVTDIATLRELNEASDRSVGKSKELVSEGNSKGELLRGHPDIIDHMSETISDGSSIAEYLRTSGGLDFVRKLFDAGVFGRGERGAIQTADGTVTVHGRMLIEQMMAAAVIRDPDVVEAAPKRIVTKLSSSLGAIAAADQLGDGWGIGGLLRPALSRLAQFQAYDGDWSVFRQQSSIFENPAVDKFANWIRKTSSKDLREAFSEYARIAKVEAGAIADESVPNMFDDLGVDREPLTPREARKKAFGVDVADADVTDDFMSLNVDATVTPEERVFDEEGEGEAESEDFPGLEAKIRRGESSPAERALFELAQARLPFKSLPDYIKDREGTREFLSEIERILKGNFTSGRNVSDAIELAVLDLRYAQERSGESRGYFVDINNIVDNIARKVGATTGTPIPLSNQERLPEEARRKPEGAPRQREGLTIGDMILNSARNIEVKAVRRQIQDLMETWDPNDGIGMAHAALREAEKVRQSLTSRQHKSRDAVNQFRNNVRGDLETEVNAGSSEAQLLLAIDDVGTLDTRGSMMRAWPNPQTILDVANRFLDSDMVKWSSRNKDEVTEVARIAEAMVRKQGGPADPAAAAMERDAGVDESPFKKPKPKPKPRKADTIFDEHEVTDFEGDQLGDALSMLPGSLRDEMLMQTDPGHGHQSFDAIVRKIRNELVVKLSQTTGKGRRARDTKRNQQIADAIKELDAIGGSPEARGKVPFGDGGSVTPTREPSPPPNRPSSENIFEDAPAPVDTGNPELDAKLQPLVDQLDPNPPPMTIAGGGGPAERTIVVRALNNQKGGLRDALHTIEDAGHGLTLSSNMAERIVDVIAKERDMIPSGPLLTAIRKMKVKGVREHMNLGRRTFAISSMTGQTRRWVDRSDVDWLIRRAEVKQGQLSPSQKPSFKALEGLKNDLRAIRAGEPLSGTVDAKTASTGNSKASRVERTKAKTKRYPHRHPLLDERRVLDTTDARFHEWFGDSKVRSGEETPTRVYHAGRIDTREPRERSVRGKLGIQFGTHRSAAHRQIAKKVQYNIRSLEAIPVEKRGKTRYKWRSADYHQDALQDRKTTHATEAGALKAGRARLEKLASTLPTPNENAISEVYLKLTNPLVMEDLGSWTPKSVAAALKDRLTPTERRRIDAAIRRGQEPGFAAIREALQRKGYDGIEYKNQYEDVGSTSYIVFDRKQALGTVEKNSFADSSYAYQATDAFMAKGRWGDRGSPEWNTEPTEGEIKRMKSVQQAVRDFERVVNKESKRIKVTARRASHFRDFPEARGLADSKTGAATLRNYEDLETSLHELGHLTDSLLWGTTKSGQLKTKLGQIRFPDAVARDLERMEDTLQEAVAEFFRLYAMNVEFLKSEFPAAYQWIDEKLAHDLPSIRNAWIGLREFSVAHQAASPQARIRAKWHDKPPKEPWAQTAKNQIELMWTQVGDSRYPLSKLINIVNKRRSQRSEKDVEFLANFLEMAKMESGTTGSAQQWLGEKRMPWHEDQGNRKFSGGQVSPHSTTDYGGDPFYEILLPVSGSSEKIKKFVDYLLSLRSVESWGRNIKHPILKPDAEAFLESMKDDPDLPLFVEVANKLYDFQNNVLAVSVEAGLMTEQEFNFIKSRNQYYVPTRKAEAGGGGIGTTGHQHVRAGIKTMLGSTGDILNPLDQIIVNTHAHFANAAKQRTMLTFIAMSEDPNMAPFVEELVEPMKRNEFRVKEIIGQLVKQEEHLADAWADIQKEVRKARKEEFDRLVDTGMPKGDARRKARESVPSPGDAFLAVYAPGDYFGADNMVSVVVDGQRKWYEIKDELTFRALQGMPKEFSNVAVRFAYAVQRLFRNLITATPNFIAGASIRDQVTAAIQSKSGFIPFLDAFRGLRSRVRKNESYRYFKNYGGGQSSLVSFNRATLGGSVEKMLVPGAKGVRDYLEGAVDMIGALSEIAEESTRVGAVESIRRKNPDTYETRLRAASEARSVTVDFHGRGLSEVLVAYIRMVPFLNPQIQSRKQLVESIKKTPQKAAKVIATWIVMPTILEQIAHGDDEEYWEIPGIERTMYWHIKKKADGSGWYRIPKPHDIGTLFGDLTVFFYHYFQAESKMKGGEFAGEFLRRELVGLAGIPQVFEPALEALVGYDIFRGTAIVPRSESDVRGRGQYSQYTSEAAKWLSRLMGGAVSARKIDHVIKGHFPGAGTRVLDVIDYFERERKGAPQKVWTDKDIPGAGALITQQYFRSSSLETVYRLQRKMNGFRQERNKYESDGNWYALQRWYEDNQAITASALAPIFTDVTQQIADFKRLARMIENNTKLTNAEKRERVAPLDKAARDYAMKWEPSLRKLEKLIDSR